VRAHLRTSLGFSPPERSIPTTGQSLWVAMPTLAPFGGSTCIPAWVTGSCDASGSAGPSPDCRLSWGFAPSDRHGAPHIVPGGGLMVSPRADPRLRTCHRALCLLGVDAAEDPGPPARRRRPFGARRAASSIRQRLLEPRERLPAPGAQRSLTKEFARRRVRLSRGVRAGETTRTHLAARRALPLVGFRGAPGTRPGRTRTVIGSVRPVRRFDAHRVHVLPGCTRPKPCAAPPALSRPFRGPSRQPRTGRPTRGVVARCFLS
jgi:hypothetical protein